ncbi:anthrone oxygenase family protein [Mycolicibacterium mengxianglii]|uniref:anthrone oxygenase family protein n=1 Tax=Mycolicibacterium mengxianglii TaxID=2736649 RepID=UPI0018D0916C|nr:anthrone oxygenase family protein [Mycolicibacterium mengxianglii]
MSPQPVLILNSAAALSAAAVGGLFYAFSTFTMRGLNRAGPVEAIAAMRGINAEAQANAPFLLLFLGSAVLALAVGVVALLHLRGPGSGYLLAGAVLSLLALVITMAANVPLNNQLDALDPAGLSAADAAREWAAYYQPWMAWNHVRAGAPLAGAVLLLVGMLHR